MKRTLLWLGFGLAVLAALTALLRTDRDDPAVVDSRCLDCNVIVVLVDTLRADHLGSYGYARPTSPNLDAFAARGVRFERVRSQSACTFPSVNSLLTSKHVFGFIDPETRPAIPEGVTSLPEFLGEAGYATAAVSASPIVRNTPSRFNKVGGFGRGFETFDETCIWKGADCVNRRAQAILQDLPEPFFLYLHYMDPHDPYRPPEAVRGTFSEPYEGTLDFVRDGDPNPLAKLLRDQRAAGVDDEDRMAMVEDADIRHLRDLYDEMILSFDQGFARLLERLEEAGRLDDTIISVVSDHGEAFNEHGFVKHCYTVHDNETRVPWLMHVPTVRTPRTLAPYVQNLDITPTILDLVGIDPGPLGLDGESVRPLLEAPVPMIAEGAAGLAYSSMGTYRSVNDDRFKLMLDLRHRRFRLFDLQRDPGERENRLEDERRRFRSLQEALTEWLREAEVGDDASRVERAEEIEKELRALGYLG